MPSPFPLPPPPTSNCSSSLFSDGGAPAVITLLIRSPRFLLYIYPHIPSKSRSKSWWLRGGCHHHLHSQYHFLLFPPFYLYPILSAWIPTIPAVIISAENNRDMSFATHLSFPHYSGLSATSARRRRAGSLGSHVGFVMRTAAAVPIRAVQETGIKEGGGTRNVDLATYSAVANHHAMSTVGKSTNIVWHECPVGKPKRQKLLGQKGCVLWITGLSGSGKSTLACALSRALHCKGYLTYVLDGDNVRHGLNKDLSFKAEDRAENIRRIGEVAKLFADAGVICIASVISPYRRDRDACRALLPDSAFIEVFMNMPLEVCEARDSKGLYKLARAGKITGFTGIDDPYEAPLSCEIIIEQNDGTCPSPNAMADQVVSYLEKNAYLQA